ncbi:hypothetical protein [Protofrankia symbiont of Coriaria ruscifolia]|uniref:hypothetical protein n=1 Tax=Protofrankia symbiont of Coriaria ruscifolia TaxID=1306542 RepID=UPI001A94B191|nr:hypothetical protein [Protofrankia symbiont of Coriaria ruscifolia]
MAPLDVESPQGLRATDSPTTWSSVTSRTVRCGAGRPGEDATVGQERAYGNPALTSAHLPVGQRHLEPRCPRAAGRGTAAQ